MLLTPAQQIWNRACDPDYQARRPGDRALQDVLRFHGDVMNGGLDYAMDVDDGRGYQAAAAASAGFRLFQAHELAKTLEEARTVVARVVSESDTIHIVDLTDTEVDELTALWERYCELIPEDDELVRIFETYLTEHAAAFEPL